MRFLNRFRDLSKVLLYSFLFIVFVFYVGKEANAIGTCTCAMNNQGRTWYVDNNNCDPVTEYPSGCEGTANTNPFAECECDKKEDSDLPLNTCTCNGSGEITNSSCQPETPRENCVTRAQPTYCYCSKETSNATDAYIAPRPGTPEATQSTTHIYNPLCADGNSISTAFGCIPYDASEFAVKFLQILFGIAGGIAFLLMVYGFILVATSSGDEKKLQAAKETITSAITGLLISIFALFLFRLIVVNILKIPLD